MSKKVWRGPSFFSLLLIKKHLRNNRQLPVSNKKKKNQCIKEKKKDKSLYCIVGKN